MRARTDLWEPRGSNPPGPPGRFYRDGIQISNDYQTGTSFTAPIQPPGIFDYIFALVDTAGNVSEPSPLLTVTIEGPTVIGRHVYYPDSYWGAAPAPDKQALIPGPEPVTATFTNVISHPDGIRGIYIDVTDLTVTPTADEFEFRVGKGTNLATWTPLTIDPAITVQAGAGIGGSNRISLQWPVGTIRNTWLEVNMLTAGDTFYFASVVGDVGDAESPGLVTAADLVAIRNHPHGPGNPAGIDNRYDINKDKMVNVLDLILARNNIGSPLEALRMITPPVNASVPSPAPMGIVETEGMPPALPDGVDPDWEKPWGKRSSAKEMEPLLVGLVIGGVE